MKLFTDTFSTPVGRFSVAVDETGAVVATAFGDTKALQARLGKCHLMDDTSLPPPSGAATAQAKCHLLNDTLPGRTGEKVREQVLAYFAGQRRDFDLPLAAQGTAFQRQVWSALRAIPFGETRTYGQLAAQLRNPAASRAVGRANATNPICLLVPCHRVIGADGSLTGFAFGEDLKRALLAHEAVGLSRAA